MWDNLASQTDIAVTKKMLDFMVEFKQNNIMIATRPDFDQEAFDFYLNLFVIMVEKMNKEFDQYDFETKFSAAKILFPKNYLGVNLEFDQKMLQFYKNEIIQLDPKSCEINKTDLE